MAERSLRSICFCRAGATILATDKSRSRSCSAWLNHLHWYKSNSVTTITASILKDTRTAPRRTLPCAAPRPKCRPNPCHSQKPNGTVSALKTKSCHCNAPCRSNVPPSPPRSNASTSKYRPFAMRRKPAKNRKRKVLATAGYARLRKRREESASQRRGLPMQPTVDMDCARASPKRSAMDAARLVKPNRR